MKDTSRSKKVSLPTTIVAAIVTLAIGLLIGLNWNTLLNQFGPYLGIRKTSDIDFSSLNNIYHALVDNFDGNITPEAALEGAKAGLVASARDPYTYYLSKTDADDFYKDLNGDVGAGIGIELGLRDGWIKVLRTLEGNPAREAGILAGDIIYKVNNEVVADKSSEEVAERIRGQFGSEVTVTVSRDGQELAFTMTREKINNQSAHITYRDDKAIIVVSRFDADTGTLVRRLAQDAVDKGISKFILDLRGNGGGYVSAARDVASLWIDGEKVVTQRTEAGFNAKDTYANRNQAILKDKSTVVLMNSSSASASEIVAGALKDYGQALILGEKSYGKGSMQELVDLGGGELLRVTIAKWYTPKGTSIDKSGIAPDIEVARTFDDINHERDPQLDRALETLK